MPTKKLSATNKLPVAVQLIERRIYLVRGQKVMLDFDLADLYEVSTKALNQAVSRNRDRFPSDFMFRLTATESQAFPMRSQIVTASKRNVRFQPYAFTEHGIAMLSSVLRSKRAVEVNIAIMRTFIKMREMLESNEQLNRKFAAVIRKLSEHDNYFKVVFDELKKLTTHPSPPRRQIGFATEDEKK
jgi:hypothetical protein